MSKRALMMLCAVAWCAAAVTTGNAAFAADETDTAREKTVPPVAGAFTCRVDVRCDASKPWNTVEYTDPDQQKATTGAGMAARAWAYENCGTYAVMYQYRGCSYTPLVEPSTSTMEAGWVVRFQCTLREGGTAEATVRCTSFCEAYTLARCRACELSNILGGACRCCYTILERPGCGCCRQ